MLLLCYRLHVVPNNAEVMRILVVQSFKGSPHCLLSVCPRQQLEVAHSTTLMCLYCRATTSLGMAAEGMKMASTGSLAEWMM